MARPAPDPAGAALAGARTIFLDAGNTLVSIDWQLFGAELAAIGPAVDPALLARAEARARPALSRWIPGRSPEARDTFVAHVRMVLEHLPPACLAGGDAFELAAALAPRIKVVGHADRLWNAPLPGVRAALEALRERGLARAGLRELVDQVVDSHLVGHEKPDPAIFEHALAISGAERERTLHVGDMYTADVLGARAAGLSAVLLDPHGDWGPVDCPTAPDLLGLVRAAWPAGGPAAPRQ
jgi:phosphoglycolate phosphatase-like HAD superfamily hydrolase